MKRVLVIVVLIVTSIVFSGCAKRTVSTRMSASAATAQLKSEGMRIWSRPLEIGFKVDTDKGDNGRLVHVYPKPGEVVQRQLTQGEVAAANQQRGLFDFGGGAPTAYVYGSNNFNFNALPPVQQAAVLSVIKEYNLDGFYVTMIEETIATTVGSKKGHQNFQVIVKGLALKIQEYGEVSPERSDANRNAYDGSKEKETIYFTK
ncbi:hypothetical protein J5690_08320 [bacterium]|nr:hypothetical protein [bacterium]